MPTSSCLSERVLRVSPVASRNSGAVELSLGRASTAIVAAAGSSATSAQSVEAVAYALARFAQSELAAYLVSILSDENALIRTAAASYVHANGFYKLVLQTSDHHKLRLHVWMPGMHAAEHIHEHRWHFASTVLMGELHSEVYKEDATSAAQVFDEYVYFAKAGAGESRREYVGQTKLLCFSSNVRKAGDTYVMAPTVLHRIVRTDATLTATLVFQTAPARPHNRLLTLPGTEPDVMQVPLSTTEVAHVIRAVVSNLKNPAQSGKQEALCI